MDRVVDKLNFLQQNHRTINEAAQRGRFRGAETTAEVVDHSELLIIGRSHYALSGTASVSI